MGDHIAQMVVSTAGQAAAALSWPCMHVTTHVSRAGTPVYTHAYARARSVHAYTHVYTCASALVSAHAPDIVSVHARPHDWMKMQN